MLAFRIITFILTSAVFVGLNYFVYRRLVHDVTTQRSLRRAGAVLMGVLLLAGPMTRLVTTSPWLTGALLWWYGVTLFTLLGLVGFEAAGWLAKRVRPRPPSPPSIVPAPLDDPARRLFLSRAGAAGALAFGGGMATFGAWRAFSPPSVTEVPIRLPGLPRALDGFTIVQLSDLHIGAVIQEHFIDQLVSVANGLHPDLVAITGDLVDGHPETLGRFVARLRSLTSRHGTHFVSGNHDYYSNWERWAPEVERMGMTVLRNRTIRIGDAGGNFDLIGVDDWGTPMARAGYDLGKATSERDPQRPSVLLAHQPNGLEEAAAKGIGLQLSGHTHGGQVFPATYIGDVIWGSRNAGLTKLKNTLLYTSRGCGFVGPPVRVGAPPEVVKVVLLAG